MKKYLSGFLFEDDYRTQSLGLRDFFSLAFKCGYDGVELRHTQIDRKDSQKSRNAIKCLSIDYSLSIICLTLRYPDGAWAEKYDNGLRALDLAAEIGSRFIKIPSDDPDFLLFMARHAEKSGVLLGCNNHEGTPLSTVAGTRDFFRKTKGTGIQLLFDPMHLFTAGEDYIGCIEEFAPYIGNVLMQTVRPQRENEASYFTLHGRRFIRTNPGTEGAQDWPEIFRQLQAVKYDRAITVIDNMRAQDMRATMAMKYANYIDETINSCNGEAVKLCL